MTDSVAAVAERALEAALAESGARDPREFYRERLRELKRSRPEEYQRAVAYYTETLLPGVAEKPKDALIAWTEYGRRLAEALAPGRTVVIDESGRARPYDASAGGGLILHLPRDAGARALLVALPRTLSLPQRASYNVLVAGKQRLGAEPDLL